MSQYLDVKSGAAYYGNWGTGAVQSVSTASNAPAVIIDSRTDQTMLYLTGAGVLLAALALFKGRK